MGLSFSFSEQARSEGLAQAFIIGRDFVGSSNVCLILGDNIFFGHGLRDQLQRALIQKEGATIFSYWVENPERYGVVYFGESGQVLDIVEKPLRPAFNWVVTGLYFFDNRVLDIAAGLEFSARGELEITDLNPAYLRMGALRVVNLSRGVAWLGNGTQKALMQAANFIETAEQRQGFKITCIEEIA